MFLDLSKAFDTINHDILLGKLSHCGIRGLALEWFRNYLTVRKQFVDLGDGKSSIKTIDTGLPQGSVLAPLLFILYLNDIGDSLKFTRLITFADDTTIYHSHKQSSILTNELHEDLIILSDWFRSNKLSLNIDKTNYIVFGDSNTKAVNDMRILISDQEINRVEYTKFLGLYIDQNLNWNMHIQHTNKKVSSGLYAMNMIKHFVPKAVLKCVYNCLVKSHLTYGLLLWGSAPITKLKPITVKQNKALKCIHGAKYSDRVTPLYKQSKLLKLPDLYDLEINSLMFKHANKTLPTPLQKMFIQNNTIHHHNTRTRDNPHVKHYRLKLLIDSFVCKGPQNWQNLDTNIRDCTTLRHFKVLLKKKYSSGY